MPAWGGRFICAKFNREPAVSTRTSNRLPLTLSPARGDRMRMAAGPDVGEARAMVEAGRAVGPVELDAPPGATAPLGLAPVGVDAGVLALVQPARNTASS